MLTQNQPIQSEQPLTETVTADFSIVPGSARQNPAKEWVRRGLDTVVALLLAILAAPLLLAVALAIKATSPGPLFYRQVRVGRGGQLFQIWKFRTMYPNAESGGPAVTASDDRRITPIGRRLRDWKLDELPQLWNVLKGDMSLVGPRPQVPRFVGCYRPSLRGIVLGVRPGITGPAALHFCREERLLADKSDRESFYIAEVLPVKLDMDVRYVQTRSLRGDFRILRQTVRLFSCATVRRLRQYWALKKH